MMMTGRVRRLAIAYALTAACAMADIASIPGLPGDSSPQEKPAWSALISSKR